MKLLSKEEEQAHYNATVKGGVIGGVSGLGLGTLVLLGTARRYPIVRHLTVPMKVFLVSSVGTFGAIVNADWASRDYEKDRQTGQQYVDVAQQRMGQLESQKPFPERAKDWARENRYAVIGGSWAAGMSYALYRLGQNPYQTTAQKLVQARVYAQGLTVLVLLATAALEIGDRNQGKGRWIYTQVVDPDDPAHKRTIEKKIYREDYAGESQWRDMVEAEERRLEERQHALHRSEHHNQPAAVQHRPKDSAKGSARKEDRGAGKKGEHAADGKRDHVAEKKAESTAGHNSE